MSEIDFNYFKEILEYLFKLKKKILNKFDLVEFYINQNKIYLNFRNYTNLKSLKIIMKKNFENKNKKLFILELDYYKDILNLYLISSLFYNEKKEKLKFRFNENNNNITLSCNLYNEEFKMFKMNYIYDWEINNVEKFLDIIKKHKETNLVIFKIKFYEEEIFIDNSDYNIEENFYLKFQKEIVLNWNLLIENIFNKYFINKFYLNEENLYLESYDFDFLLKINK